MKKNSYIYTFLFLSGVYFFSCKKDNPAEEPVNFGYNYFPNDISCYVIYQVDSIHYDDVAGQPPDTTRYLLKEIITATYTDNSGRPTERIERFYKIYNDSIPYDSMNWVGPRVWSSNKTNSTYEKIEENIRYIKLIFPVKEGKQWNGNTYNSLGSKEYELVSVDEPEIINSLSFDSVATVKQFEQINIIETRFEQEKFARNVGLIYKQRDSLSKQGLNFADTIGYTFIQKIVSYGK